MYVVEGSTILLVINESFLYFFVFSFWKIPREKLNQVFKKRISLDIEDAGFQEGDYISEEESDSDINESILPVATGTDAQKVALRKRE